MLSALNCHQKLSEALCFGFFVRDITAHRKYIKMINIKKPLVLMAPMAGVTDRAFRRLCLRYGADLVFTEMVSAKAVSFGDEKSYELARLDDSDRPASIQIFGSEPKSIAFAAKEMLKYSPVTIDINMGCPVPKIAGSGDGSALMKKPELAGEIIYAAVEAVDIPVTVKIRSGWDSSSINAIEIAKIAESNGAAAITVHGRTRAQGYEGKANRSVIKSVKSAVNIPVFANGDVRDGQSAIEMLDETGCDGVMVGRGALGSPWIFEEIKAKLENRNPRIITAEEKREAILEQLEMMVADKGESSAIHEIRKHIAWYIKGIPNAASIRASVFSVHTKENLKEILSQTELF